MATKQTNKQLGVTLVEMMLVAVVIAMFFVMFIGYTEQKARTAAIDKASMQMQQILNASLDYYIANQAFPASMAALQAPIPYIPVTLKSPWGTNYTVAPVPPTPPQTTSILVKVTLTLPNGLAAADAIGATLAGKVPYGASTTGSAPTTITAQANIPGQNVNSASAINFAGVYHNGACVPVPTCPLADGSGKPMAPEIIVTPTSVSGANDVGTNNVYPISSFTAFAIGPSATPGNCFAAADPVCTGGSSTNQYWRVCIQVVTAKGQVTWDSTSAPNTANLPLLSAMTRCSSRNEPAGSASSVFGP